MQEHTVKAFDEDITRLRGLIAEMGGLAEVAIQRSLEALVKGDDTLAKQVIKGDKRIDALESEIDKLAIRVIALRAPMADDLREVIAALKIAGVVERIGDYSKNIAKASREIEAENRKKFEPLTLLPAMAEVAAEMVHDVLTAYAARDAELAREVIATDEKVDAFYNSIFRNLVSHMVENPAAAVDPGPAQGLDIGAAIQEIGEFAALGGNAFRGQVTEAQERFAVIVIGDDPVGARGFFQLIGKHHEMQRLVGSIDPVDRNAAPAIVEIEALFGDPPALLRHPGDQYSQK